jgi:hypothetical protein
MKLLARLLFFRPKPTPTLEEGVAILDDAIARTLQSGLSGFVLGSLQKPGVKDAHAVVALKGDIEQGLTLLLKKLLADPETKNATIIAAITALQENGAARFVQVIASNETCTCPVCVARREEEGKSQPVMKPH